MAKHINEQISAYIDGMMAGKDKAEFEKHLNECEKCKKLLEETKKALNALHEVKDKPLPSGYLSRLSAKLDIADGKEPRRAFNFNIYMKGLAALAALIFVVVMTRYTLKETNNFSSISTQKSAPAKEEAVPSGEKLEESKNAELAVTDILSKKEAKIAAKKPVAKARNMALMPAAAAPEEKVKAAANIDLNKSKDLAGGNYTEGKLKSNRAENQQAAGMSTNNEEATSDQTMSNVPAAPAQLKQANIKAAGMINTQWAGTNNGQETPGNLVFKDAASWQQFTANNSAIKTSHPDIDMTDFNSDMLVALFMGEKPTAGYSIEIISIEKTTDKVIVKYKENVPAEGAIEAQVITHPYCIKAIENSTLPVEFQKAQ